MSTPLFQEALIEAKKLREAAANEAKNAVLEAVSPMIKQMIDREISGIILEQEEPAVDALPPAPRLPLRRGTRRLPDPRHRRLLRRRTLALAPRHGRRRHRLHPAHGGAHQSEHAVHRHRHHRRDLLRHRLAADAADAAGKANLKVVVDCALKIPRHR